MRKEILAKSAFIKAFVNPTFVECCSLIYKGDMTWKKHLYPVNTVSVTTEYFLYTRCVVLMSQSMGDTAVK